MTPAPLEETVENERIVLRMFRGGADTIDIARRLGTQEPQIARMLRRARQQEQLEQHAWQAGPRS